MDAKFLNAMRMILLVLIFLLLVATAALYFLKGEVYIPTIGAALGCFIIYLVTGRKAA
ncbi:MAG: hypothetical protein M3033_17070 [Acidobacteriota bacterium]|nr:hypothetical protein [Acidobacteriota bacterium]